MRIVGNIDCCDDKKVAGWITIVGAPSKKLRLEITLRNVVIGRCVADNFRQDLLDAGIADGNCAFNFVMPAFVAKSELKNVAVRLENSVVTMNVTGTPIDAARLQLHESNTAGELWIDREDWLDR